jgi:hypothetical protein
MDGERGPASSRRLHSLAEKFRETRYRDGYVAAHTRSVLADQVRNFRGHRSQAEYAAKIGKQKTVVGRLENPGYAGWSLRTMFEIARKEGVAVFVRFVDFPTFLKYSDDLSDDAMRPRPYDAEAIDELLQAEEQAAGENALRALFSAPPKQDKGRSAWVTFDRGARPPTPANDAPEQKVEAPAMEELERLAEVAG